MTVRLLLSLFGAALLTACGDAEPAAPAGAARLAFLDAPTTVAAGAPFAPAVQVAVLREDGALDVGATSSVTLRLTQGAGADTLRGATTAPVIGGVASFPDLRLTRAGTTVTLVATAPGMEGAVSGNIVVDPGPVARLRFTTAPGAGTVGQAFTPAPVVVAEDAVGNVVARATGTLGLGLAAAPTGAVLSGPTVAALVSGVATFTGVRVDRAGSYALSAELIGSPAVSPAVSSPIAVGVPVLAPLAGAGREP